MRILSAEDVRACLPMHAAVEHMKQAFASLARGEAVMPARARLDARAGDGITLVMSARVAGAPGSLADETGSVADDALAVKVVSVFEGNVEAGIPRILSAVLVMEPATGRPLALLEGSALTAVRTAAASGAATDLLAPREARTLAILGAGVQARSHIEAMCAVRAISTIRIFGPTAEHVDALIAEIADGSDGTTGGGAPGGNAEITRAQSPAEAVRGADIVCTTTTSATPVFEDADVAPGAHINAVGTYTPGAREVSGATVARSWVVVDDREAAWIEAGELIQARAEGRIDRDHVRATLGELVLDPALRPGDPDQQPTLFKSVGVAVQDAVAAAAAVKEASRLELGSVVDW